MLEPFPHVIIPAIKLMPANIEISEHVFEKVQNFFFQLKIASQ